MTHGEKRDYPKINIFVGGKYYASTTWAKTCKDAVEIYRKSHSTLAKVTANFDERKVD